MTRSPEPDHNPNSRLMVDPPGWMRFIVSQIFKRDIEPKKIKKRREKTEKKRQREGRPHEVHYFHQLDDPYSHLSAQVLKSFTDAYNIQLVPHLIHATGGDDQPEMQRLATWARRDAELIAPHYGLDFPANAPLIPHNDAQIRTAQSLLNLPSDKFVEHIAAYSTALWAGTPIEATPAEITPENVEQALSKGTQLLKDMGHYSGAIFYYAGEWYWGIDRLFYLEQRLKDLGAAKYKDAPLLAPRPVIEINSLPAAHDFKLEFFYSLNSPYSAIIFDKTMAVKDACGIEFHPKPVLPMIMRGVPASTRKGHYIFADTKREADHLGVPFGPYVMPIGEPVRRAFALMGWAKTLGKDESLMRNLFSYAFMRGIGLHKYRNMKRAVIASGLDWEVAKIEQFNPNWKARTVKYQDEMNAELNLWGVPSYRLSGPDGEPDLCVWGQDRLWLVSREIKRRANAHHS